MQRGGPLHVGKVCYPPLTMANKKLQASHLRLVGGGAQEPTEPDHETINTILREFLRKYGDKTPISITCIAHLSPEDLATDNQTGLVATLWRASDCSQLEHLGAVVKFSRFMDEIFDNENEETDG